MLVVVAVLPRRMVVPIRVAVPRTLTAASVSISRACFKVKKLTYVTLAIDGSCCDSA